MALVHGRKSGKAVTSAEHKRIPNQLIVSVIMSMHIIQHPDEDLTDESADEEYRVRWGWVTSCRERKAKGLPPVSPNLRTFEGSRKRQRLVKGCFGEDYELVEKVSRLAVKIRYVPNAFFDTNSFSDKLIITATRKPLSLTGVAFFIGAPGEKKISHSELRLLSNSEWELFSYVL